MIKKKYSCLACGKEFIIEVFEPGEAEEKMRRNPRLRPVPITCSRCKGRNLKEQN